MTSELKLCKFCGSEMKNCGAPIWEDYCENNECTPLYQKEFFNSLKKNTRAVPDVPELVRYRPAVYMEPCLGGMFNDEFGEYVRYDQAAAVIAAKDKEIQELKENLGVVSTERHADAEYIGHLQAELAQIKTREHIGYITKAALDDCRCRRAPNAYVFLNTSVDLHAPIYASPVDQTPEIERLRNAAKKVIARWDSPHWKVTAPTADVLNELRDAISGTETS